MAYDFKKEYRDLYLPKGKPMLIDVPAMVFAAVAGTGDPNEEGGSYQEALDVKGGVPAVCLHHEIYQGDPRRTKPENLKTVIRHPVRHP